MPASAFPDMFMLLLIVLASPEKALMFSSIVYVKVIISFWSLDLESNAI